MRIGIDCRLWSESTGRYIREIVNRLAQIDKGNDYIIFLLSNDIDKIDLPSNFKKVKANVHWHTFEEQIKMPIYFYKHKLDILHVPYFNVPIFYFKKFIPTIHDLTVLRTDTGRASTRSKPYYFIKRLGFRVALMCSAFFSSKVFTVSEYVKKDIVNTLRVKPDKVVVTPNGVSNHFKVEDEHKVNSVLQKYGVDKPYLFYMGNAHPHKNIESLLEAFERVKLEKPNLKLVIGGKKDFFVERLIREWKDSRFFPDISFIGFVDDSDAPALYTGAEFFVYPSYSEGFGLQILESFSCGTPVICSNITSLPEIAGEAGYYFDPYDIDNMVEVILKALNDSYENKKRRINLGFERTNKFSWEETAKRTLEIYKSI